MSGEPVASPRRVVAIDLLRLVMSAQMIQGHTIGALLDPRYATGPVFETWTFCRGLTAVGFLLAAGASYAIAAAALSDPWRRVRRAAFLILCGFALRPPIDALSDEAALAARAWDGFFSVDVLQCIGVTLLCLEGTTRVSPQVKRPAVAAGIAAVLILLAPLTATLAAEPPLRYLVNWVSRTGGSLFPLLPWSGFVWLGVALGPLLARAHEPKIGRAVGLGGAALALVGRFAEPLVPPASADAYYASPAFSAVRIGLVLVLFAALAGGSRTLTLPPWARVLSNRTLTLYVTHLVALYASGVGLIALVGPRLGPGAAIVAAALLVAASVAVALWWDRRVAARGAT